MRSLVSTKQIYHLRTISCLYFLILLNILCDCKQLVHQNVNEEIFALFDEEDGTSDYYTEYYDYDDQFDKKGCEDDLPQENCTMVLNTGKCGDRQDMYAMLCMKTCGYCKNADDSYEEQLMRNTEEEEEADTSDQDIDEEYSSTSPLSSIEMHEDYRKECEDKLPTCQAHYSQEFCCQMKQAMNYSCEKTCKFCSQTPATLPPPPGGNGYVPTAAVPTATSNQDPCRNNEGKPPSVTADTPGHVPGVTATTTTTTTSNPIQGAITHPPNTQLPIPSR